jgi:hypothetical protein
MKLEWPGFTDKGTLLIPLDKALFNLPDKPVIILNEQFQPKDELHITVIGKKLATSIVEKINNDKILESSLKESFESIDWGFRKTDTAVLIGRDRAIEDENGKQRKVNQKSVIAMVDIPGMAFFYNLLKSMRLIDEESPAPPPHITLYTMNCPNGIGIVSDEVLTSLRLKTLTAEDLKENSI